MSVVIRKYVRDDLAEMRAIWNSVVAEGRCFPQDAPLSKEGALRFFEAQTYVGVAEDEEEIVGLFILQPNSVGRCGHIVNAAYAVRADRRGRHIGQTLINASIQTAKDLSFRILQLNAVPSSNETAIRLYEKLCFQKLGAIPGGFRLEDGAYEDIFSFYRSLV